jgi:hypothetical protein
VSTFKTSSRPKTSSHPLTWQSLPWNPVGLASPLPVFLDSVMLNLLSHPLCHGGVLGCFQAGGDAETCAIACLRLYHTHDERTMPFIDLQVRAMAPSTCKSVVRMPTIEKDLMTRIFSPMTSDGQFSLFLIMMYHRVLGFYRGVHD